MLSVTVTLNLNGLPIVANGVPLITPVKAFSVNPGGSEPVLTVHLLYGGVPPAAESVAEYALPTVPSGSELVVTAGDIAVIFMPKAWIRSVPTNTTP